MHDNLRGTQSRGGSRESFNEDEGKLELESFKGLAAPRKSSISCPTNW